jgi:hypothetical protein
MPDEDQLSLRQADQIRGDLYALQDNLDLIKHHLNRPRSGSDCQRPDTSVK